MYIHYFLSSETTTITKKIFNLILKFLLLIMYYYALFCIDLIPYIKNGEFAYRVQVF